MSNRTYELIYVLKPDAPETEVAELHKQVADIVERLGGTIDKTENAAPWGRRRLAYEIGHHKEGFYVLEVITGSAELMKGNRPPPQGDRRAAAPPDRPRRRVDGQGRAHAQQAHRRVAPPPRGAWPAPRPSAGRGTAG